MGHKATFAVPDRGVGQRLLCVTVGHRARFAVPARFALAWQVTKIKYGEQRFSIWRMEFFRPAVWHVALGLHDIEFAQTSAILEFYFRFQLDRIIAVGMSFCTSLRNFIQIGRPTAEK